MEARYLEQPIPFLKKMENERKEQFIAYFKTAPVWLLESFKVEEMDKGTIFVREGEPVMCLAGSAGGEDTVAIVTPAASNRLFELKVNEVLAKPSLY